MNRRVTRRIESERGVALAVAIFALVVVGGLVGGALFVGTQEQRIGRNTLRQQEAFAAAEAAAQELAASWNTQAFNQMPAGSTVTTQGRAPDGRGWYRRTVQRLNQMLFLVSAEGFSSDNSARQRVGMLMRLRPFQFNINAALKTQGQVRVGGSSWISGRDAPPNGWPGCSTQPVLPGIRMPDPSQIQTSGCSPKGTPPDYPCIEGSPQDVLKDTSITTQTLTDVGGIPFDSLRLYANKYISCPSGCNLKIQPVASGGVCSTGLQTNWGEPWPPGTSGAVAECFNYFPIIYVNGNLSINQVRGQGVLIVNGDLDVQGGFEFYGPVLVRGTINTQGTGGHFNGGVIAANVNLDQSVVLGDAVISFSSCALIRATTASATAVRVKDRSWISLY